MFFSDLLKKFKYSWGKEEFKPERKLWQAIVAEYIGCIVMNLFGCSIYGNTNENQLFRCFGFGLVMFVIVNFTLSISGGHINPSISISFLAMGRISLIRCLLYLIAQLAGSVSGSFLLFLLCRNSEGIFEEERFGATDLNELPTERAIAVEFFINLVLNLTVYSVTDSGRKELAPMAPFSIGMNIAQAHLAAMKLTGPGMNPARSLGTAVMSGKWDLHWVYWVGPISGGIAGGLLYLLVFEKGEVQSIAEENVKA